MQGEEGEARCNGRSGIEGVTGRERIQHPVILYATVSRGLITDLQIHKQLRFG